MLLTANLHEDFITVKSDTVSRVFSLQSPGVLLTTLYAPEADRFVADSNAAFSQ
jgi:hypothetical protein